MAGVTEDQARAAHPAGSFQSTLAFEDEALKLLGMCPPPGDLSSVPELLFELLDNLQRCLRNSLVANRSQIIN